MAEAGLASAFCTKVGVCVCQPCRLPSISRMGTADLRVIHAGNIAPGARFHAPIHVPTGRLSSAWRKAKSIALKGRCRTRVRPDASPARLPRLSGVRRRARGGRCRDSLYRDSGKSSGARCKQPRGCCSICLGAGVPKRRQRAQVGCGAWRRPSRCQAPCSATKTRYTAQAVATMLAPELMLAT